MYSSKNIGQPFDYLIVGAGLYGAVFAHEMTKAGKKCIVIDKRPHIGGNIFTEKVQDIIVHKYGAHIFHTNDRPTWEFINEFAEFNNYVNSPIALSKGRLYNLPFNMNTFYQLWGVKTPEQAQKKIQEQISGLNIGEPNNLEEQALLMIGPQLYEILVKEYTIKQWGKHPRDLPAYIIKRLPLRFTYDNNYFNDAYQGIPIGGYSPIIKKLLKGCQVELSTDYFSDLSYFNNVSKKILYTGKIDQYFHYRFGTLEYRSLRFEEFCLNKANYQGNAVVNYCDLDIPYTRIIEHKHFEFGKQSYTVLTKEFPTPFSKNSEPYYPVNDPDNNVRYKKYRDLAGDIPNVIFGGRLAEYKYYDMNQIVSAALKKSRLENIINNK